MRYIKLGTTGLDVSPIAIGAMTYGDPGRGHPVWSLDEETSRPLIKHALEAGINFFDTANLYSYGSSEEILGRALRDFADRDEVVIATKLRHPMRPGPNGSGLSRKAVMTEVDHSLRRLGTDYIDLYQIHRNDHATPLEETLEALHDLVKAGKVRYIGASSMPAWEFAKALHRQRQHGWARFVSMQNHYNLLAREEEREMIPLCLDEGVGAIIWSPLARGRLARPWEAAKSTARAETDGGYADTLYSPLAADSDHAIIDAVGAIAAERGVTRAQVALAWLHSKPVVTAPLVGANTTAQIDDAVASLGIELTSKEIAALERPYTPRYDWQGVSDEAELQKVRDQIPGYANAEITRADALGRRPGACRRQIKLTSRPFDGIISDTIEFMAMTLRLADDESEALRRRSELEQRSMQEVARQAIREYIENHSRAELLDQVLDEELPRYAEALQRLGQ